MAPGQPAAAAQFPGGAATAPTASIAASPASGSSSSAPTPPEALERDDDAGVSVDEELHADIRAIGLTADADGVFADSDDAEGRAVSVQAAAELDAAIEAEPVLQNTEDAAFMATVCPTVASATAPAGDAPVPQPARRA